MSCQAYIHKLKFSLQQMKILRLATDWRTSYTQNSIKLEDNINLLFLSKISEIFLKIYLTRTMDQELDIEKNITTEFISDIW